MVYDMNPEHAANLSLKDLTKRWSRLRSLRINLDDALLAAAQREKALNAIAEDGNDELGATYPALRRN